MDFKAEIFKSIQVVLDKKLSNYKADRTYKSVITQITQKGYVVLDTTGNERTVPCCIPGVTLRAGQRVWIKEPLGDLKGLHICGVL